MLTPGRVIDRLISNGKLPVFATDSDDVPWVPLAEGKAIKPLRFLRNDRGYVGLLRIDPGVLVPLHRHTGETHEFNLKGWRELDTGQRIGPGGYVYEPVGTVDSWRAVGDEPMVALVVVRGAVEHLDDTGAVKHSHDAAVVRTCYERYCKEQGMEVKNLVDR